MAISSVESSAVSLPWGDMEHKRRRTPRYPFDASIEMRVGTSQDQRTARVTGLSLNGCYVSTESPYPEGSALLVKVFTATEFYEGQAAVIYTQEKLGMGLMFELPVLIFFLSLFGIVTPKFLWKNFRYAILIITVIAAIVTPTPDATTMLVFMAPMIGLYFLGIAVSAIVTRRRERRIAAPAEAR